MAVYAAPSDLLARYSEAELRQMTDPRGQAFNSEAALAALGDASEEIDFWIGQRYVLPLVLVNPETGAGTTVAGAPALVRCCCDIAVYRLQATRPADDIKDVRRRYEDAIALLKLIAKGEAALPFRLLRPDAPVTNGSIGSAQFNTAEAPPYSPFDRSER